jgi:CRP-like cAMP-binding protein
MRRSHIGQAREFADMTLFCDSSPRDIAAFGSTSTRIDLPAGSVLLRQGQRRQEFGVVVDGTLVVQRDGCPIARLRYGEHFGEFSLLRAVPSPVTLLAETPVTVAVMTGSEFRGTIADDGPMRARIEHELDQRITHWLSSVRRPEPAAHATG